MSSGNGNEAFEIEEEDIVSNELKHFTYTNLTNFFIFFSDKENRLSEANSPDIEEDIVTNELKHLTSTPAGVKIKPNIHLRSKVKTEFPEGRFFGFGRHRDGAEISKYFYTSKFRIMI